MMNRRKFFRKLCGALIVSMIPKALEKKLLPISNVSTKGTGGMLQQVSESKDVVYPNLPSYDDFSDMCNVLIRKKSLSDKWVIYPDFYDLPEEFKGIGFASKEVDGKNIINLKPRIKGFNFASTNTEEE
jgi:hypothetical protein